MKKKHLYAVILGIFFLLAGIQPALAAKSIPSDTSIGTWDSVNRIFTLTTDVYETVEIDEDNLTLDGAGHTVTGTGSDPLPLTGVYLHTRTGVTIKNLNVQEFVTAIRVYYSSSNTLTKNNVSNNNGGIHIFNSSDNTVTDNITLNNEFGIYLYWSGDTNYSCSDNILTGNTVSNNSRGIQLNNVSNNQIYNNNFITNTLQVYIGPVGLGSGNVFNLAKPVGGNYWSDWTSPDDDGDGFVDSPYEFTGGIDNLPWAYQDGWKIKPPAEATEDIIEDIEEMGLPRGTKNSLVSKLENAIKSMDKGQDNAAAKQLKAFIKQVKAQSGKKITEDQADALIAAAQSIIDDISNNGS